MALITVKSYVRAIGLTEVMLLISLSLVMLWMLKVWRLKRIFAEVDKWQGPRTIPILGNAWTFIKAKNTEDVIDAVLNLMSNYYPYCRFWLGNYFFYSTCDPLDFEAILSNNAASQKADMYKYIEPIFGDGLFVSDAPKWRRVRKILVPGFNQKLLNTYVTTFSEHIQSLTKILEKHAGKGNFDIFHTICNCTLDIVCETTMGYKMYAQERGSDVSITASRCLEIGFYRMFHLLYHFDPIYRFSKLYKEEKALGDKFRKITMKLINKKREEYIAQSIDEAPIEDKLSKKSFMDLLLEVAVRENWHDDEIFGEVGTFMIGVSISQTIFRILLIWQFCSSIYFKGSDTSATVTCFTFIMLGMFPDVQQKVYQEMMDVVGPNRLVESTDIPKLKYTEMVIKETMRLFPVAPVMARVLLDDIKIGRGTLPKGTFVLFCTMILHRDPKYWPDPLKFDPLRFLPEAVAKRNPYQYNPFSNGPRNCIAWKFGMMSVISLVASVVRSYHISTSYRNIEDVKLKPNLISKPKDGYNVSLEIRR